MGIDFGRIGADVLTGGLNEVAGNPIPGAVSRIVDPGKQANQIQQQAVQEWQGLPVPGQAHLDYGTPGGIQPYQTGTPESAVQTGPINPFVGALEYGIAPSSAAGLESNPFAGLGPSSFSGLSSAYGGLGPSAYEGATSAYGGLGPSAASKLGFSPEALKQEGSAANYFRDLSKTGSDPIAEADYQRRAAAAEQGRKADLDAALQQLEMKGQGNAGGALSAAETGAQGAASDKYQAGLDAAAEAAQRRDTAAQAGAGIASQMGQNQFVGDQARALAMDKYNQARAAGMDDFTAKRLSGLDQYATNVAQGKDVFATNQAQGTDTYNTNVAQGSSTFQNNQANTLDAFAKQLRADTYGAIQNDAQRQQAVNDANFGRQNQTSDANTGLQNSTTTFNDVTAPQTTYQNNVTKASGLTGQQGQQAQTSLTGNEIFGQNVGGILQAGAKAIAPTKAATG